MALDAEAPQSSVRLALPPGVHRPEDRVLGGVGVHAAGPLGVLVRVAALTDRRIEQLRPGEHRRPLGRRAARAPDDRRGNQEGKESAEFHGTQPGTQKKNSPTSAWFVPIQKVIRQTPGMKK